MDGSHETAVDPSEVRSVKKRRLEDGVGCELDKKKARGGCGDVRLAVDVKKVAEMVLVLATLGKMRGGRKPTPVEVKMMAEARGKLAEVCEEFSPRDIFPKDAFGMIIEDLGLNRLRETQVGNRPPKMSIAEKLQLTKQKMEKSEVFPLHSTTCTPGVSAPHAISHAVPSSKPDHAPISSGSFQNHPNTGHSSSISNSRTLPYQLPTSQVRPVVSNNVLTGKNSTGRPQLPSDERSNGNAKLAESLKTPNTPTWSTQLDKGPVHMTNINHHIRHRMNFVQSPSIDTHNEISKIVQKILQPHTPKKLTWTPPSRDYINKALTCQTCKIMINDVDSVILCDGCEKGYHLKCLHSNPKEIFGDEWKEWHCVKCLKISNGKSLPPKYGRVMRNVSTPKMSLEKKSESSMIENGSFGSQSVLNEPVKNNDNMSTDMQVNGTHEGQTEKSTSKKSQSNSVERACENTLECNTKGVDQSNKVNISENCTSILDNEDSSSSKLHDVEWVGGVINEVDGKTYYESCSVNGIIYKLQDYALFHSSNGNELMPNKLQGMWEGNKTNKKLVAVTRCFFPDDLPEGVGRPCAPESNEVYESNHETTFSAGLIHGSCEVLPPRKFSEQKDVQNHSQEPKTLFLCKWFYDEKKRLFRDVTC